jgi:radical SAM protein with 4Fe4S-binding SPASM domain
MGGGMGVLKQVYLKARGARIPLSVHFDLTYRCPQRCLHCYLPESWRRRKTPESELSTAEIHNILDQLAAAGTFFLSFSGGEIFLRPDIFTILEYARRKNFSISLLSTGTCNLGEDQLKQLVELQIERLLVSFYSLKPHIHDEITGVPGSWAAVRRTIERCQELGIIIALNCVLLSLNRTDVEALRAFAAHEGIQIRFDPVISPRFDGRPHPSGLALGKNDKISPLYDEGDEKSKDKDTGGCGAGLCGCYINPSGEIWPCVDFPWPCGSLKNGARFEEIWHDSPRFNQVRHLQERLDRTNEQLCRHREQCIHME